MRSRPRAMQRAQRHGFPCSGGTDQQVKSEAGSGDGGDRLRLIRSELHAADPP